MPFDNPHQTSFGDLDVLEDARSRIFTRDRWTKRRFQIDERLCVVAALSLAAGSDHRATADPTPGGSDSAYKAILQEDHTRVCAAAAHNVQ